MQIDNKKSDLSPVRFGVLEGSILGPFIFNFYVSDISVTQTCCKYAKDTTIYEHCKSSFLNESIINMANTLESLNDWSVSSNLLLNPKDPKSVLFYTKQMSQCHSLHKVNLDLYFASQDLEHTTSVKILGILFKENMDWNKHVKYLTSSCYVTLATLRKLKHLTSYSLRKQLTEMLVISKLDYCDTVRSPLYDYQTKRLQRIQNACAGFVMNRYATVIDVISIGWLPMRERRDWHMLKMAHKA